MASFTAISPLSKATVGREYTEELGTTDSGDEWFIPQGTILPPGIGLDKRQGKLFGTPTVPGSYPVVLAYRDATGISRREFLFQVEQRQDISDERIAALIDARNKLKVNETTDDNGKPIISLETTRSNGQPVTIASVTLPLQQ